MSIEYCADDWSGIYENMLKDCRRRSITLSDQPLTILPTMHIPMNANAEMQGPSDRVLDRSILARMQSIKLDGGLTGYTTSRSKRAQQHPAIHIVLDRMHKPVLFGECVPNSRTCQMASETSAGRLTYSYDTGKQFDFVAWKEQEARILALIKSWQP